MESIIEQPLSSNQLINFIGRRQRIDFDLF